MNDITIETMFVPERGCGLRQKGGFYVTGDMPEATSGWFPQPLDCPCGFPIVKPSRSVQALFPGKIWKGMQQAGHESRLLFAKDEKAWACTVDLRGYPTPEDYIKEGLSAGISRRLNNGLPKGFVIGESRMFIIHGKAIKEGREYKPGFIACFMPKRIEYVVIGNESKEYLSGLAKKGITLVNVTNARPAK